MNWISNVVRPKIRNYFARRETPENLWIKCPETGQLVFYKDVEANQFVIPGSNYHMRMGAMTRLKSMFDNETWFDIAIPAVPLDPLRFRDELRYADRLKDARAKTGTNDAIKLGFGKLEGMPVVIGVQDFDFMGGSLGMAAGEAVIKGLETAVDKGTPFIMFAASGGARMQEGIFSLMQLPRTTLAVQMLREARRPYVVVLTNPTTGGVTASYAMLGAGDGQLSVSRAHRSTQRSEVVRCRPGIVTERRQVYAVCASLTAFGGPGSAVHRSTSFRAAPHPGHVSKLTLIVPHPAPQWR